MLKQECASELSRYWAVYVLQHEKYSRAGKVGRDGGGRGRSCGRWRANLVRLCLLRVARHLCTGCAHAAHTLSAGLSTCLSTACAVRNWRSRRGMPVSTRSHHLLTVKVGKVR